MFDFLYELLGGEHRDLPRRRREAPDVEFDAAAGTFVSADGADTSGVWLTRGEIPGAPRAAAVANEGQTVADEMRELAQRTTPSR